MGLTSTQAHLILCAVQRAHDSRLKLISFALQIAFQAYTWWFLSLAKYCKREKKRPNRTHRWFVVISALLLCIWAPYFLLCLSNDNKNERYSAHITTTAPTEYTHTHTHSATTKIESWYIASFACWHAATTEIHSVCAACVISNWCRWSRRSIRQRQAHCSISDWLRFPCSVRQTLEATYFLALTYYFVFTRFFARVDFYYLDIPQFGCHTVRLEMDVNVIYSRNMSNARNERLNLRTHKSRAENRVGALNNR